MAYSPHQQQASQQLALALGCLCFIFLLFLSLFYHRIPSLESLGFMLVGSGTVGLLGYYLGTVIYSQPKAVPQQRKESVAQVASKQADDTHQNEPLAKTKEPPPPLAVIQQGKLQDSIPAVTNPHSEHEWVDTASPNRVEDTAAESKAFKA